MLHLITLEVIPFYKDASHPFQNSKELSQMGYTIYEEKGLRLFMQATDLLAHFYIHLQEYGIHPVQLKCHKYYLYQSQ